MKNSVLILLHMGVLFATLQPYDWRCFLSSRTSQIKGSYTPTQHHAMSSCMIHRIRNKINKKHRYMRCFEFMAHPGRIVSLCFTPLAHSLSLTGIPPSAFRLRVEPSGRVLVRWLRPDKLKTGKSRF